MRRLIGQNDFIMLPLARARASVRVTEHFLD